MTACLDRNAFIQSYADDMRKFFRRLFRPNPVSATDEGYAVTVWIGGGEAVFHLLNVTRIPFSMRIIVAVRFRNDNYHVTAALRRGKVKFDSSERDLLHHGFGSYSEYGLLLDDLAMMVEKALRDKAFEIGKERT
jgi:hypothetical protein